jgi:hypothetical protein
MNLASSLNGQHSLPNRKCMLHATKQKYIIFQKVWTEISYNELTEQKNNMKALSLAWPLSNEWLTWRQYIMWATSKASTDTIFLGWQQQHCLWKWWNDKNQLLHPFNYECSAQYHNLLGCRTTSNKGFQSIWTNGSCQVQITASKTNNQMGWLR